MIQPQKLRALFDRTMGKAARAGRAPGDAELAAFGRVIEDASTENVRKWLTHQRRFSPEARAAFGDYLARRTAKKKPK